MNDRRVAALLVLVVAGLTAWLGSHALGVELDRDSSSMDARDPLRRALYEEFRDTFGGDESIVLAIGGLPLERGAGWPRLDAITRRVEAIDGVGRALSLTSARTLVGGEAGAEDAPLVPRAALDGSRTFDPDEALRQLPALDGLLVSRDRRTVTIVAELDVEQSTADRDAAVVVAIRAIAAELRAEGLETFVTGLAVQKYDAARLVARDQRVLLPLSLVVLAAALALATRRRSGVVLPLGVTAVSLIWTLGLYALLGFELNVITSLLPPVVLALSIPTGVHLYQAWVAAAVPCAGEPAPVRRMFAEMWSPCLLTALTTAAGLASLGVSSVPAVRQFGLFAAAGVLISFALNLSLLPIAFGLLRPPPPRPPRGRRLERALAPWARLTTERPGLVLLSGLVLTAVVAAGIPRVRVDTDLLGFLKRDEPLRVETAELERRLGGTSTFELVVERADGARLVELGALGELQRFHDALRELPGVVAVLGLPEVIAQLHRAELGLERPRLPDDPADVEYYGALIEEAERRDELDRLVDRQLLRARTNLRVRASGTADALTLIAAIERAARDRLGPDWRVTPTGGFYLVATDSERLVTGQLRSFALALATVLLALALVFRGPRVVAAAVVPNLAPIVWTTGAMGWFGVPLSAATAMVASVVIGIAVDDTIHYLARFRREHTGDVRAAVRRTTVTTGRVLVITSAVLALGFWVGAFGSFMPTIWFSLLAGVTILGALVCDLLLLPACLVLVRPRAIH